MQLVKKFLVSLLVLTSAITLNGQGCSVVNVRREFRQLTNEEKTNFLNAMKALKQSGRYDEIVNTHLSYVPHAHSTAPFFPWHRYYIYQFENALRSVNPNIILPYWDWTIDAKNPENSDLWNWFGGNGDEDQGFCLVEGPFAGWNALYPRPHCLTRRWNGGHRIASFWSHRSINNIIRNSRSYDELRHYVEPGPHANVHFGIGGDFGVMSSPNDPLFWMHHAYVDKIWADWQEANPSIANDYGGINILSDNVATLRDRMDPFDVTVGDVISTNSLCYRYSNSRGRRSISFDKRALDGSVEELLSAHDSTLDLDELLDSVTDMDQPDYSEIFDLPGPFDREGKKENIPMALDLDFIHMYGFDVRKVRHLEIENALWTKSFNQ